MYVVVYFGGRWDGVASPFEAYYRSLGLGRAAEYEALTNGQAAGQHWRHRGA
jgi:hypothetical protein